MNVDELKRMRPYEALIVIKALRLRKKYEELLVLRYVDDLSCDEIADKKHKEVQTIRNEVSLARKQFNKYVNDLCK